MRLKSIVVPTIALALAASAHAAIIITEVDPTGSGTVAASGGYVADWFELTNTGNSQVDITGWRVDDSSPTFATSLALNGVTLIDPGQSVVFIEATSAVDAAAVTALKNTFKSAWFGANVPAGFTIGDYSGSGIGLSSSGDAVNIYDASVTPVIVASVSFGASTAGKTFDNAAGATGAISTISAVGVNGAFSSAASDVTGTPNTPEVGSPGVVPEPASFGIVALALTAASTVRRRRR